MNKPLVTVGVLAYNQEKFIADALQGVFAQDYEPLEILIADDGSRDGTVPEIERVLREYSGRHPVRFLPNETNQGLIRTLNNLIAQSKGEIFVVAAGDDVSLPDRITVTVRTFAESDAIHSVYGNGIVIDADGREIRPFYPAPPDPARLELETATREGFALMGASHAWSRRVFDTFGPLPEEVIVEDNPIGFRSAFLGTIRYVDRILVRYRQHGNNMFLGTMSAEGTVAQWHHGLVRYLTNERAIFRGRLYDLDVAEKKLPARATQVASLREVTMKLIAERDEQLRLLGTDSLSVRIAGVARMAFRRAGLRYVIRWFLTLVTPAPYLRLIRWRTQRAGRR